MLVKIPLTSPLTQDDIYIWRGKAVKCLFLPRWEGDYPRFTILGPYDDDSDMEGYNTGDCTYIDPADLEELRWSLDAVIR